MKILKSQLRQIIKEVIQETIQETFDEKKSLEMVHKVKDALMKKYAKHGDYEATQRTATDPEYRKAWQEHLKRKDDSEGVTSRTHHTAHDSARHAAYGV